LSKSLSTSAVATRFMPHRRSAYRALTLGTSLLMASPRASRATAEPRIARRDGPNRDRFRQPRFSFPVVHICTANPLISTASAPCTRGAIGIALEVRSDSQATASAGPGFCPVSRAILMPGIRAPSGDLRFPQGKSQCLGNWFDETHSKYNILWFRVDRHHRRRYFFICGS
jgi:hypothetical protein